MKRFCRCSLVSLQALRVVQRGGVDAQQGPGRDRRPNSRRRWLPRTSSRRTPQIPFDAVELPLMPTSNTIGETEGVAINSKKHLFVFSRTSNAGPARGAQTAHLFEFDGKNAFVKEWGQNAYGFSFAHAVRVDKKTTCGWSMKAPTW